MNQKRYFVIFSLFVFMFNFFALNAKAQKFSGYDPGQKSIGFLLGVPTVVRYDLWTDWKQAWFFDVGYHHKKQVYLQASKAYFVYDVVDQWKKANLINLLLFYYGPGVVAGYVTDSTDKDIRYRVGLRLFGGFQYSFGGGQWALRTEVGPVLHALGDRALEVMGGIGLVYSFETEFPNSKRPDQNGVLD